MGVVAVGVFSHRQIQVWPRQAIARSVFESVKLRHENDDGQAVYEAVNNRMRNQPKQLAQLQKTC